MQLTEILNSIRSRARGWINAARNPGDILLQEGARRGRERLEGIELPLNRAATGTTKIRQFDNLVQAEPVSNNSPSNRLAEHQKGRSAPLRQTKADPLPSEKKICREQYKYRQTDLFQQKVYSHSNQADQGSVCWYRGNQTVDNEPVLVRQYILPTALDEEEIDRRKVRFEQLNRISFNQTGDRDFRLLMPLDWDINAETNCCYLVTESIDKGLPDYKSLRDYLTAAKEGIMPPNQVRQVLKQVLQTLWFLQTQKVRLATGEVKQGLAHGHLNLDSLRYVPRALMPEAEPPLLIYVSDLLGAGESLFIPSDVEIETSTVQDLKALGWIGFSLMTGVAIEPLMGESIELRSLDFDLDQRWQKVSDRPLKQFIVQLLRQSRPTFNTAFTAREALLDLDLPDPQAELVTESESEEKSIGNVSKLFPLILIGFLTGLGFLGIQSLWMLFKPTADAVMGTSPCCINDVVFSENNMSYAIQKDSIWTTVIGKPGLIAPRKTLLQELRDRMLTEKPNLRLNSIDQASLEQQLEKLRGKQIDFVLAEVPTKERPAVVNGLEETIVAYDGIVVFVAFNDATRGQNIPNQLGGDVTFDELRQYFTASPTSRTSTSTLPAGWIPKLYLPFEPSAVDWFQQRVLQNANFNEAPAVTLKRQQDNLKKQKKPDNDATSSLYGEVLRISKDSGNGNNNQSKTFGIGFGFLSTLMGQCSVYPLALAEKSQAVQPLIQDDTGRRIDPTTDLCSKGSYSPNIDAFASGDYPLAYSLVVIHRKDQNPSDGKKFADMLVTDEGQCLLSKAGLVPLRPHPCD